MRTGLLIFGVIFLVIGILIFLAPLQEFRVDTETIHEGNVTESNTSYARVTVPLSWALASFIAGIVLLIFGLIVPAPAHHTRREPYDKVVESREVRDTNGKKHKVVRETREKHVEE